MVRQLLRESLATCVNGVPTHATIEAFSQPEQSDGTGFSFDMLGEEVHTQPEAQQPFNAYVNVKADGLPTKLCAVHPRYAYSRYSRVVLELLPRVKQLATMTMVEISESGSNGKLES